MIDQSGNKIVENKPEDADLDFVESEMRFFMKGFRKERDDTKAIMVAKCITTLLRAKRNNETITKTLEELEMYSPETSIEDFLWELVYCRRAQAECYESGTEDSAECRCKSADIFNTIVNLYPTEFNLCCRVQEYVTSVIYFMRIPDDARDNPRIRKILDRTEDMFCQIKNGCLNIYNETGDYLYLRKYLFLKSVESSDDECFAALGKAIHYISEIYKRGKDEEELRRLIKCYNEYVSFEQFSRDGDKQHLSTVIDWAKNAQSIVIRLSLGKLKTALANLTD